MSSANQLNRSRFTLDGKTKLSMRDIVKGSCKTKGIIYSNKMAYHTYTQKMKVYSPYQLARMMELRDGLLKSSELSDFPLMVIQITAILSIAYRRSGEVNVAKMVRQYRQDHVLSLPYNITSYRKFSTSSSDIGSPVFLDMPTGTGKTITSLLGSIVFAIERREDVISRTLRTTFKRGGVFEITGIPGVDPDTPEEGPDAYGKCIFFTPKHLIQHWKDHAEIAKRIVENMVFKSAKWTVRIVENVLASKLVVGKNEIIVILCDLVRCGISKYLEPSVKYASVCFDEAGEKGSKNNALCQKLQRNVQFGRMIAVSADFSKWWNLSAREDSVFRSILPNECIQNRDERLAICVLGSIFREDERRYVLDKTTEPLKDATLDIATVRYTPSLMERIVGGVSTDLGNDRGCDIFEQKYGVSVSGCETIPDILETIRDEIGNLRAQQGNFLANTHSNVTRMLRLEARCTNLSRLVDKIREIKSGDCPICFEPIVDISLIQPCLHFTCISCMTKVIESKKCPMCRGGLCGTVGVKTSGKRKAPDVAKNAKKPKVTACSGGHLMGGRVGDLFFDEIASICDDTRPVGITGAVENVLTAVQNSKNRSSRHHKTFRTMLICPDVDIKDDLFKDIGFDVYHYRTSGTKHSRVTGKKMNTLISDFQKDDGKSKLICVRDSLGGKVDNMTGLNIPLDCVITIGNDNYAQRVGRLCRISRSILPKDERDALYVQIKGE